MASKLGIQAMGSYLKLPCEYELQILSNIKVSVTKNHDENYTKVRPPLVPGSGPPSFAQQSICVLAFDEVDELVLFC